MKMQVENPALANSSSVFDGVLFLDINFQKKLKLTGGSSYLPPPDWNSSKTVVINLKNLEVKECFKWALLAALRHKNIDLHVK